MTEARSSRARMFGAPATGWRRTMKSACMASMLRAVSSKVSPFTTLLSDAAELSTSASSRWAGSSKEVRVRVLGSKNRFTTVLPRRVGTFLMSRPVTSLKDSAVSRTRLISSTVKSWMPSRSLRLRLMGSRQDHHAIWGPRLLQINFNRFFKCSREVLAHIGGFDRELPVPAIHQHRQLDLARASQVNQPVHGGPDRPAGEEDVVHQDHLEVCDVERNVGLTQHRVLLPRVEIVTIEGDVQLPDGDRRPFDLLELFGEPFGEVHAAGPNAHQGHVDDPVVLLDDLVRHAGQGPVDFLGVHDRAGGLLHFHTVTLNKVKGLMGIKKPSGKPTPEGNGSRLCRSATTCAMSDSFPASQDWS